MIHRYNVQCPCGNEHAIAPSQRLPEHFLSAGGEIQAYCPECDDLTMNQLLGKAESKVYQMACPNESCPRPFEDGRHWDVVSPEDHPEDRCVIKCGLCGTELDGDNDRTVVVSKAGRESA